MKSKLTLIIVIVVIVVLLAGASLLYQLLTSSGPVGNTPGALITGTPEQSRPDDSQLAPDIAIQDQEGNMVRLSDFSGEPVVLNYWASWCPPCVAEMPEFEQLYQEYGTQLQFIMLNDTDGQGETVEHATQFVYEQGFTFPVYFDVNNEGARAYDITAIPQTFFIDRDGYIVSHTIGMIREKDLREGIALIL